MGNDAAEKSRRKTKPGDARDGSQFFALPYDVLDAPRYRSLPHPARALLLELGRQLGPGNNGQLRLGAAKLRPRGWKSSDTLNRAKQALLEKGFIFETVKGHRPNKASWYAVTWHALAPHAGYDPGAARAFERGAYRRDVPLVDRKKAKGYEAANTRSTQRPENAALCPAEGARETRTAPSADVSRATSCPPDSAVVPHFHNMPAPPDGNHLDMPSDGVVWAAPQGTPPATTFT